MSKRTVINAIFVTAGKEVFHSIMLFLLLGGISTLIFHAFSYGEGNDRVWENIIYLQDRYKNPLSETLLSATLFTFKLIGASLLISIPLATVTGWICALFRPLSILRLALTILSSVPMVAAGYLLQYYWGNEFLASVFTLAITDLTVSVMTAHIATGLREEFNRPYLTTVKSKGASLFRHYWPRLASLVLTSIRPRIPYLISGSLVVERIFLSKGRGLSSLVIDASENGDLSVLYWVSIISLGVTRILGLIESLVLLFLLPQNRPIKIMIEKSKMPWWYILYLGFDGLIDNVKLLFVKITSIKITYCLESINDVWRLFEDGLKAHYRAIFSYLIYTPVNWYKLALVIIFSALSGAVIILSLTGWCLHNPEDLAMDREFSLPSWNKGFLLGCDFLGRDLFSMLLLATRNMLLPTALAVLLTLALGIPLGLYTGYKNKGILRRFILYMAELFESMPKLLMVLTAIVLLDIREDYLYRIMPVIGITFTPLVFNAAMEKIERLKTSGFLEAQWALGTGMTRLLGIHLLWNNGKAIVFIQGAFLFGYLILFDLTLCYLGYGQPDYNLITLGKLAVEGIGYAGESRFNSCMLYAPLLLITILIATSTLLADAFRVFWSHGKEILL